MSIKSYICRAGQFAALDSRRADGMALLVPAYILAVLFLMPSVTVYYGQTFADTLKCVTMVNCPRLAAPIVSDLANFVAGHIFAFFKSGDPDQAAALATRSPGLESIVSDYLARIMLWAPLVVFIAMTARRVGHGLFFLFAFMLLSSGWGFLQPILKTDVLRFVRPDQFHPFWEFGRIQALQSFDLFALSYLLVLALILAYRSPTVLQIAVYAAFGQAAYEHLGFIAGVAAFLHALCFGPGPMRSRLFPALCILVACGIASIAVVVAIGSYLYLANGGSLSLFRPSTAIAEDAFRFAKYNIDNYRYILFRSAYFLFFPAAFGLVSGVIAGFVSPLDDEWRRRYRALAAALFAILAAYFGAATIGFFTVITYSSEMAREFYAFVILLFFLTFALGTMGGGAGRRRIQSLA